MRTKTPPQRFAFLTIGVLLLTLCPPASAAKLPESSFSVLLGQKALNDDDWEPVESQVEWGVIADLGRKDSVANLVISYLSSSDDSTQGSADFTGETWELGLGIRKPFRLDTGLAPFVEVGAAYVDATLERRGVSPGENSDSAFGIWGGVGIGFAVGERVSVGALLRYTAAEVTLLGADREAGGLHFGVTAGIGF